MVYYHCLFLVLVPVLHLLLKWSMGHRRAPSLRLPPGPWQLPVIGSLHHLRGGMPHVMLRDLARRHGPLMFLKFGHLPVVVASSREAAEEVFRTNDAVLSSRPQTPTLRMVTKRVPDVVLAQHGDQWRQLRKIVVQEILNAKRVRSFRQLREQEAMRLVQEVTAAAAASSTPRVNLDKLLAVNVSNVTVCAILGDVPAAASDLEKLQQLVDKAIQMVGTFHLADLFQSSRLARALSYPSMRRLELLLDGLFKLMDRIMAQHEERKRTTQQQHLEVGLIDVLLRIRDESRTLRLPLTMASINGLLLDLIGAGSESVSTVVSWALVDLMRNPTMMSRAQSEVRNAFMGQMKVTEEGLDKLSYLHCVIKETLRLHPLGPFGVPRESQETCRVLGHDVPKGALVLVNLWAIFRDPQYWDDPDTFEPTRFEGTARDFNGRDYDFLPFGSGRRICPGMLFGLAIVDLTLANLLFYFDWSPPDGTPASELDMTETVTGLTVSRKAGLWLKPTRCTLSIK